MINDCSVAFEIAFFKLKIYIRLGVPVKSYFFIFLNSFCYDSEM